MLKKVLTLLIKIILFTKVQLIPEKFVKTPNGTKVTADSFQAQQVTRLLQVQLQYKIVTVLQSDLTQT